MKEKNLDPIRLDDMSAWGWDASKTELYQCFQLNFCNTE